MDCIKLFHQKINQILPLFGTISLYTYIKIEFLIV